MKRAVSAILWILAGAAAVGIGTAFYLNKANKDRTYLSNTIEQVTQEKQLAEQKSQQIIQEANKKLEEANQAMTGAQEAIKTLQTERDLMAKATILPLAAAKTLKGWKEAVSVSMGMSIKLPPTLFIETNDASSFTLSSPTSTTSVTGDARWFSAMPYDQRLDQELTASLASSTAVSYLIDGQLLLGRVGTVSGRSTPTTVLHVQQKGRGTLLLWIRQPSNIKDTSFPLTVLSTMTFKK